MTSPKQLHNLMANPKTAAAVAKEEEEREREVGLGGEVLGK